MLTVKIVPNETGNPPGKLADAELHFGGAADSIAQLDGLDLIGFAIWERRGGQGGGALRRPASLGRGLDGVGPHPGSHPRGLRDVGRLAETDRLMKPYTLPV